jgi:TonB-linked SusC/RagA family outer membrane protein
MSGTLHVSGRSVVVASVVALALSARSVSGAVAYGRAGSQRQIGGVLDRPARLDIRDVTLVKALQELADHARIALVYSPSLVPDVTVSCPCATSTAREALETLLEKTALTFREAGGQVMLVPSPLQRFEPSLTPADDTSSPQITLASSEPVSVAVRSRALADSAVVIGRVTSDAGAPVLNALVSVRDLRLSTTTNEAGLFRLVVPPDRFAAKLDTLHVVRLGYRPAVVAFRLTPGQVSVDVVMSTAAVELSQIVVTGTAGNQERQAQAAVVASVDATDIMAKAPVLDVNQLLYAQSAGVSMTTASGTSGANTRIDIRGQASISLSNYPLVFIDGVRATAGARVTAGNGVGGQTLNALNDLNPDDIETIEVVKGPAAATLYGADASAGVIQILTKKGRPGTHQFSQRISTQYDNIDPNFTPFTNYAKCTAALVATTSPNPLCKGQAVGTVVSDNVLVRNSVFSNGSSGSVAYSAQGGGDNFGYYASFDAMNESGTTPDNFLNHRSGRVNFTWIATPKLSLDASVSVARMDDKLPKGDQDSYGFLLGGDFGSPASVIAGPNGGLAGGWFIGSENVEAISAINTEDNTLRATPSVQLHYSPVSWFSNRLTFGQDFVHTLATQLYPKNNLGWYSATQNTGVISVSESDVNLYTVDYLANISGRFGARDRMSSDLSFGSQWINAVSTSLGVVGTGLLTNTNTVVGAATTTTASQGYAQSKSFGYFGQEQLGFSDRLYLQFGARIDRNSAFGKSYGAFFLPKAGISYVVSQEPFWQQRFSKISTFRLRAAYGTTGRSPSSTAALQTYSKANYITDAGVVQPGVSPGSPGNENLKPERGTEFEGGFDAGFFHDRLGLEATYYDKRSKDLLLSLPIAPSSGFSSSPLVNIGEVSNKGLELSARATVVSQRNLNWDFTATTNMVRNRIENMGSVTPFVSTNNQCFKPGMEVGAWCVPQVVSVDTVSKKTLVTDTAVNVGGQLAKYEASLSSTLTLRRNLRLYAQFDGKFGYKIYDLTQDFRDRSLANSAEAVLPADQGGYSTYERQRRYGPFFTQTAGTGVGSALVRDPYMVSGDFIRLREMAVTWSLPTQLGERFHLAGSSISVGGRNLWLSTKYPGWDPEVNGADGLVNLFRADVFTTPQNRRLFTRLNFQF